MAKTLIAYFSHAGQNYSHGSIRNLNVGNTEVVAKKNHTLIDSDSFIESYDLAGKTVIPFNTHERSGQSGTQRVIENALPDCTVLQGFAIQGKTAQENETHTRELLTDWLTGLSLMK